MMITKDEINNALSGRGVSFDPQTKLTEFYDKLDKIDICENLLPKKRGRSDYFNDNKYVGCHTQNLLNGNETAFSRALFNQRFLSINGQLSILLDYEVVLSKDRRQKVDLLAYKVFQNTFVAIEYKINPSNGSTGIEYGLFEAYCYGYLLNKYLSSNTPTSILYETKSRLRQLGLSQFTDLVPTTPPKSEYLLSAPASYFSEFIRTAGRAEDRFLRIQAIESFLNNENISKTTSIFLGYLPIAEVSHKHCIIIDKSIESNSFPFLMTVQKDIEAISHSIRIIEINKPSEGDISSKRNL